MEFERLTTMSEIIDSPTLKSLCESCGESGCTDICEEYRDKLCVECPVQQAFERLSAYEDSGLTPAEVKQISVCKAIYEAYDGSKLNKADQYIERLEKSLNKCIELLKGYAFVDPDESENDRLEATPYVQILLRELGQGDWIDNQIEQNKRDFEDADNS